SVAIGFSLPRRWACRARKAWRAFASCCKGEALLVTTDAASGKSDMRPDRPLLHRVFQLFQCIVVFLLSFFPLRPAFGLADRLLGLLPGEVLSSAAEISYFARQVLHFFAFEAIEAFEFGGEHGVGCMVQLVREISSVCGLGRQEPGERGAFGESVSRRTI
ncbi:hypothetical protein IQ07DRAFT_674101, partial [Pyrenochaeta sp. DS3sAY3a]